MKKNNLENNPWFFVGLAVLFLVITSTLLFVFKVTDLSVQDFPNSFSGDITLSDYCEGESLNCGVMKVVADSITGKAQVISEGTITADRMSESASLKFYFTIMSKYDDCQLGDNQSSASVKASAWNFEDDKWDNIFTVETDELEEFRYMYDVGFDVPNSNSSIDNYGECYIADEIRYCSYKKFNADSDYIDPTDKDTIEIKLEMFASGTDCGNNSNRVGSVVEFQSIWAEFTPVECITNKECMDERESCDFICSEDNECTKLTLPTPSTDCSFNFQLVDYPECEYFCPECETEKDCPSLSCGFCSCPVNCTSFACEYDEDVQCSYPRNLDDALWWAKENIYITVSVFASIVLISIAIIAKKKKVVKS